MSPLKIIRTVLEKNIKADNARSEFLSRMNRELRTPLNAIIGFDQLIEMEDDFNNDQKENIHEIYTAGNHQLYLVNDLIDISRIENNIEFLDIKPNKLETIIQENINMVKPIQKKYHISINANQANE